MTDREPGDAPHAPDDQPGPLEEAAGERLGVERWDRPLIFRDAADAAVDAGLPYWLVLVLSGAIATLGLAMDSSAVVIGAMLVAPLLGPIVGLSLALAVGDARLALQTFVVVGLSLIVVIATAAGLTALLPFHTVTLEISSRIRPTTLDLGVAVCSGLVGALVTVARGKRLSAAIPGVAVAVALIPPLAVAGFGMAAGWRADVVWGALLLLGANLAGIVLSGVGVFLLVGMHRGDVVEAARRWHDTGTARGVAAVVCRLPGVGRAGVFGSALGRSTLVFAFVVALAIPLSSALSEVVREARVRGAVADAVALLEAEGTTSALSQHVELGTGFAVARVRVTTSAEVSPRAREAFRRRASELAGEPVGLRLEQLPVATGGTFSLGEILDGGGPDGGEAWPETLARARETVEEAAWSLPFPEGAMAVQATLVVEGVDSVTVAYLAPDTLASETSEVLGTALRRAVGHPGLRSAFQWVGSARRSLDPADAAALDSLGALQRRLPHLTVSVVRAPDVEAAVVAREALRAAGVSVEEEPLPEPGPLQILLARGGP